MTTSTDTITIAPERRYGLENLFPRFIERRMFEICDAHHDNNHIILFCRRVHDGLSNDGYRAARQEDFVSAQLGGTQV